MAITSTGIGSNLDIEGLISKLMAVEQRPLNLLATKETSYQTKLTAYSMVQSALSQFQSTVKGLSSLSKYQSVSAAIGNKDIANVSAGSTASQGTYSLKVSQLAQNQKLAANGVASDKTSIGNGTITFDFGTISGGNIDANGHYVGSTFTSNGKALKSVTIEPGNNTLAGIRDAINRADVGMTASIVNVGGSDPYRLVLTSNETGAEQSVKITVAGNAALSNLMGNDPAGVQNMRETSAAKNAQFTLDGIEFSKSKNSVTDAIDGVTLELLKTNTDSATNVTVTRDTKAAADAVNSFVSAYNTLTSTLKSLTAYNAEKKEASALTGDSAVRSIQEQLRSVLTKPIAGGITGYSVLSDVGVSMGKDGMLSVESTKLSKALDKNFNAFVSLFAEGGTTSSSSVMYTQSSLKTKPGTYNVHVDKAATQGYSVLSASSLNLTGKNTTMQLKLNGVSTSIKLDSKVYGSAQELAEALQSKINSAGAASGSSATVTVDTHINQAATQGYSVLSLGTDGLDLTGKDTTMQLKLNGVSTSISLEEKVYGSKQELADELQSKINSAGAASGSSATVTVDADGNFKIQSNSYGSVSNITLDASDGIFATEESVEGLELDAEYNFKIQSNSYGSVSNITLDASDGIFATTDSKEGIDVSGTINGMAATGSGQFLTAAVGSDAEGIKLQIVGDQSNFDSTVSFAQGYAYQFSKVAESMLDSKGTIAIRMDGVKTSLKGVAKDQARIEARLVSVEARYRRQFTALDVLLSNMNQTSNYLTQQLDALSNLYKK